MEATASREQIDARIDALEQQARFPENGIAAGGSSHTAASLRTFVRTCGPAHLAEVDQNLATAEGIARRDAIREAWRRDEDERRDRARQPLAPDDPDAVEHQRMLEEARALARRDAGAPTYGQIADLIAVTRDVLDELRKRG